MTSDLNSANHGVTEEVLERLKHMLGDLSRMLDILRQLKQGPLSASGPRTDQQTSGSF